MEHDIKWQNLTRVKHLLIILQSKPQSNIRASLLLFKLTSQHNQLLPFIQEIYPVWFFCLTIHYPSSFIALLYKLIEKLRIISMRQLQQYNSKFTKERYSPPFPYSQIQKTPYSYKKKLYGFITSFLEQTYEVQRTVQNQALPLPNTSLCCICASTTINAFLNFIEFWLFVDRKQMRKDHYKKMKAFSTLPTPSICNQQTKNNPHCQFLQKKCSYLHASIQGKSNFHCIYIIYRHLCQ